MTKRVHPLFSIAATRYIQEVCKPLQKLALTNFMHDITFGKGEISMLVSNEDVFLFYYRNKIPMLCTDETGRTLAAGLYLNKVLESNFRECAVLMPLLPKIGQQYGHNYGQNSIHVVAREDDCQHLYSLFFDLAETDFLHWVVNNGYFLNDLLENYNAVAKDIILEAKAPDNRIVLPSASAFNLADENNTGKAGRLTIFHKQTNMPVHLSNQQSACLSLLAQGKSAKEIARLMQLSHRTVEHYLEIIRKLLGCASTKELIASYMDQLAAK